MALAVDSLIWTQFSKGVSSGHILRHASSTAFLQFAQLPINETKGDPVDLAAALKSLVEWSATDLLQVVNLLTDELGAITSSKVRPYFYLFGDVFHSLVPKQKKGPILQSQTILLDALGRCLLQQWDIVVSGTCNLNRIESDRVLNIRGEHFGNPISSWNLQKSCNTECFPHLLVRSLFNGFYSFWSAFSKHALANIPSGTATLPTCSFY